MNIAVAFLFAVSLAFWPLTMERSVAAESPSAAPELSQKLVPAPIRLQEYRNLGYVVNLGDPYRNRGSDQFLVSIDGDNLRDESLEQIQKRLWGFPGTTTHLGVVYSNGDTEIIDVVRGSGTTTWDTAFTRETLFNAFRELNSKRPATNLLESDSTNVDLVAKAYASQAIFKALSSSPADHTLHPIVPNKGHGSTDVFLIFAVKPIVVNVHS